MSDTVVQPAIEHAKRFTSDINMAQMVLAIILFSILWEHFGRLYSFPRPSSGITWIADWLIFCFEKVGTFAAYISSFYTYIRFQDLLTTMHDLLIPIWKISISPYYFLKGYISAMNLYDHPYLVFFGSATILASLGYAGLVHWSLTVRDLPDLVFRFLEVNRRGLWVILSLFVSLTVSWVAYNAPAAESATWTDAYAFGGSSAASSLSSVTSASASTQKRVTRSSKKD